MGTVEIQTTTQQHHEGLIAISALIDTALAAPAGPPEPYYPAPAPYHVPAYADVPPAYNFAYAVADDYSGSTFGASETRDGYATSGSYNVALPDGRIQTVTYHVDDAYGGYVADVSYSGEPVYPKYEPKPYKPAPHPAPYHPAPAPYHPAPYHG